MDEETKKIKKSEENWESEIVLRETEEFKRALMLLENNSHGSSLLQQNKPIKKLSLGTRHFDVQTNLFNFNATGQLFYCPNCLESWQMEISMARHSRKCKGAISGSKRVHKEGQLVVYKVAGYENVSFCQSLCILGRCFIENKTLFLDIENYFFYLLFDGTDFVGYFSEEIYSDKFNLSCILVLPDQQKKGFGTLLVDLSYKFKAGTPEKPLSISGTCLYKKYWQWKIKKYLADNAEAEKSILDISKETNLTVDDVVIGLELCGFDLNKEILFC